MDQPGVRSVSYELAPDGWNGDASDAMVSVISWGFRPLGF
jgi:hypothetical protein